MSPIIQKYWFLPAAIAAVVLSLLFMGSKLATSSQIQQQGKAEGEILIVPIQLERDSYGLAMVDTATEARAGQKLLEGLGQAHCGKATKLTYTNS